MEKRYNKRCKLCGEIISTNSEQATAYKFSIHREQCVKLMQSKFKKTIIMEVN